MDIDKGSVEKRKRLYDLVDELQDVRRKLKEAQASDSSWFFSDSANDAAVRALKTTKDRIAVEIRGLEKELATPEGAPAKAKAKQ